MRGKTGIRTAIGVLFGLGIFLFVLSCGDLPDLRGSQTIISSTRRVFVNDQARNDSLMTALAKQTADSGGLLFVLQPGQKYHLRLATASTSGDQISLYGYDDGGLLSFGNLTPTFSADNDTELFTLQSTQSQAIWFAGILQAPDGTKAAQRISHVSLVALDSTQSYVLNVNLIMVGKLSGLPDSAHKAAFADSLGKELRSIYQGANGTGFSPALTFNWTYSIVTPDSAAAVLNFGPTFVQLPGTRVANAANLYLVDNITFTGAPSGESVLGFSPREVVDMSTDQDSRVILSAQGAIASGGTSSITSGIPSLATTTAHELGHFFGLRHPTATTVDLDNDNDLTNQDDGFPSTPVCTELTKSAAGEHIVTAAYNKRAYCLYMASATICPPTTPTDCNTLALNLMFAYSYPSCSISPKSQRVLTSEQQVFFRRNLALLQGK